MSADIMLVLVFVLLATGCVSGLLAGLFGVGGGLIMVPAIYYALTAIGYPGAAMHTALATSLVVIVMTSVRSALSHHRRGAVDWAVLRDWALWIVAGAAAGSLAAGALPARFLTLMFGTMAVVIALFFLFGRPSLRLTDHLPSGALRAVFGFSIGGVSAMIGIGGGLFGVTLMSLCGRPAHQAVGTSAGLGALIGAPAALGYVASGWDALGRAPLSLGYVSLPGFVLVSLASVVCVPLGVAIAHRLDASLLKRAFGLVIALNGAAMLARAL